MTREQTAKIIRIIGSTYPSYRPMDTNDAIEIWQVIFNGVSYETVSAALYSYISQNHEFAPTPGQIKEIINHFANPNELTESEAWDKVLIALRNGIYGAEEEYARLPEDVQKAIGSPHYLHDLAMQEDVNYSVESSNFFRRYRTAVERRKEIEALPIGVRGKVQKQVAANQTQQIDKQDAARAEDRKRYAQLVDHAREKEQPENTELAEKIREIRETNGSITEYLKRGGFREQEEQPPIPETIDTMFA